jgi:UDP-N-acetylmuramoyl-tripeptide--D-alanyl-D-alanine ligase
MLELGAHAVALHEECGRAAAESGLSALVTVGGAAAESMASAAGRAGMASGAVRHVGTAAEASTLVRDLIRPGDLVLVKGSRGVRMDLVADRVREEWR